MRKVKTPTLPEVEKVVAAEAAVEVETQGEKIETPPEFVDIPESLYGRVLTIEGVAKWFGCSTFTVNRMIKSSGLPCKQVGVQKLFSVDRIVEWIEEA